MAETLRKLFEKAFNKDNSIVITRAEFNARLHMVDREVLDSVMKDLIDLGLIKKERKGGWLRRQV